MKLQWQQQRKNFRNNGSCNKRKIRQSKATFSVIKTSDHIGPEHCNSKFIDSEKDPNSFIGNSDNQKNVDDASKKFDSRFFICWKDTTHKREFKNKNVMDDILTSLNALEDVPGIGSKSLNQTWSHPLHKQNAHHSSPQIALLFQQLFQHPSLEVPTAPQSLCAKQHSMTLLEIMCLAWLDLVKALS